MEEPNVLFQTAIPKVEFPSINEYDIDENEEELVSLRDKGFICEPRYYNDGIPGALSDCYVRASLVPMLKKAESLLGRDLRLKIWDGYRPIFVQQRLWNLHRQEVINEHAGECLTGNEIDRLTSFFVSRPSFDENRPSLHNTGGAVDLTVVTKYGQELNMGTDFDAFGDKAWTNNFEMYSNNGQIQLNRRLLYNAMTAAGFTNLPSEWWHYDYGDKFWAYFTGNKAIYKGKIEHRLPCKIFPLS